MKTNPYIILSAEKEGAGAHANADRTEFLKRQLQAEGFEVIPVVGSYEGIKEASFMVPAAEGSVEADALERLAWTYGQDSVLYIDPDKRATLTYQDGSRKALGPIRELGPDDYAASYTQLPNGRRFAA